MSFLFASLGEYEVDAIIDGVITRVEAYSSAAGKYDHLDSMKYAGRGKHHKVVLNGREIPAPRGEFHFWKGKPKKLVAVAPAPPKKRGKKK